MRIDHEAAKKQNELPPAGEYSFEIIASEEKVSQAGQDMFALRLTMYDNDARKRMVKDWVGAWNWTKLRILCEAVGLDSEYEAGEVEASSLIGRTGVAKFKLGKDMKGEKDELKVDYYIPNVPVNIPGKKPVVNTFDADLSFDRDLF